MEKKIFILEDHLDDQYEIDFGIDEYTHLRAFHACRPIKLSDYLDNGILPISYESALQDVRDRVVCDYVSEEDAILKFQEEWSEFEDIHNVFNSGDTYDISFAVDKVLPQDIVDYEHPTKRLVDPYGGTYKPDYEKLKIYL